MTNSRWIRITGSDNIPPREGRAVLLDDREIAIFNLGPSTELGAGDRFLAVDNRCPHRGGPLADGIVSGGSVVCPLHAWKVDLHTGSVERPSGLQECVRSYPTRVEDGIVMIQITSSVAAEIGAETAA
jgi:nitrite reductase (NADH) small subunit